VDSNRFPRASLAAVFAMVVALALLGPGASQAPAPSTPATSALPAGHPSPVGAAGPAAARLPAAASGEAGAARDTVAPPRSSVPDDPSPAGGDGSRRSDGDEPGNPAGDGPTDPAGEDDRPVGPAIAVSPEGFLVVQGSREAGAGPTVRFTVEVEPATGIDPGEAHEVADSALLDQRSWARDHHLVRVGDPTGADVRVLFATPATVDRLCHEVGLDTGGVYSCWTGTFAAINAWRYAFGATGFSDRGLYRRYVVNHEVGHGLGYRHVDCPAEGATAPVMMQQSVSLGSCIANGWPYPDG
jgi:hypothetical protein